MDGTLKIDRDPISGGLNPPYVFTEAQCMYFKADVMIHFDAVVKNPSFFSKMTMFEWKNQVLGNLKTIQ